MVHSKEVRPSGPAVKRRGPALARPGGPASVSAFLLAILPALLLASCDGEPTNPSDLRFGQVGELLVEVRSPVADGAGVLDEALRWRSDGPWVLVERFGYAGRPGDESERRPRLNPGELAAEYGSLVRQLNETPGLRLFSSEVPQELDPSCSGSRSRVTFTVRDDLREEEARWVRCVDGTLFTASPGTAGPDAGASRVVTAAQLMRFFTIGEAARSSYLGSVPFATVERGEDSPARLDHPRAFRSTSEEAPAEWEDFWAEHAGAATPSPPIDWASEMVLVAAIGKRQEAGEAVKVQRILPIEGGVRVEILRTVPGDFCSPAAREIHPFHILVTPRRTGEISFNDPIVNRVACGG